MAYAISPAHFTRKSNSRQSKEFRTLEGDYRGYSSDFTKKKGSQKKFAFCSFFC